MNNSEVLNQLAQQLAFNHFNASLSTKNIEYENEIECYNQNLEMAQIIFNNDVFSSIKNNVDILCYSRNILIIGAGASKNACTEIYAASQIIEEIYFRTGMFNYLSGYLYCDTKTKECHINKDELLNAKISDIRERNKVTAIQLEYFFYKVSIYMKNLDIIFPHGIENVPLRILFEKMTFESALKILQDFVKEEDIAKTLQDVLGNHYKILPNLFYEITAHLFKHRFFDVIINLNFDELLDSAIEDEMGETEYIKIFNDATCIDFEHSLHDGRLRKPIYIKPHGTISDIFSIQYTVEQYLSISQKIKEQLINIFKGTTSIEKKDESCVRTINILSIGYAYNDLDIKQSIFEHFKDKDKVFNFYISDAKKPGEPEIAEKIKQDGRFVDARSGVNLYDIRIEHEQESELNINRIFVNLFERIKVKFQNPFAPTGITRHELVCNVFDYAYLNSLAIKIKNENTEFGRQKIMREFYLNRAKVNLTYEFVKFNGHIPKNVIFTDRGGKYYGLYLENWRHCNRMNLLDGHDRNMPTYIIDILKEILDEKKWKEDSFYITGSNHYKCSYEDIKNQNPESAKTYLEGNFQKILLALKKINPNLQDSFSDENRFTELCNKIAYSVSYEINAKYNDPKHRKFYPFSGNHIINTNLGLTYHFYKFLILDEEIDEIKMISKTGSPLINLHWASNNLENSNLQKIAKRMLKIELNSYVNILVAKFITKGNEYKGTIYENLSRFYNITNNGKKLYSNGNAPIANCYTTTSENQVHQMVLFMANNKVKHAIYYFKPINKNRINPIWFSTDIDENDNKEINEKNLKILLDLYESLKTNRVDDEKLI